MSSTSWNDQSLMNTANQMSCQAMLSLVKKEHDKNKEIISHQIADSDGQIKDRSAEYKLFLNGGISRNLCFEHDPALKTGEYFSQIENTRTESFDNWTRVKTIAKPVIVNKQLPEYDLDSDFFNCMNKIPNDLVCAYNAGNRIDYLTCPQKCDIHPKPCPNPIR